MMFFDTVFQYGINVCSKEIRILINIRSVRIFNIKNMSKKLLKYIKLPVVDDGMGIYIFDSVPDKPKILLQFVGEHLPDSAQSHITLAFCQAFNEENWRKDEKQKLECYENEMRKYVALPVVSDGKGDLILDNEGKEIMSVRGWGGLQREGEEEATNIQIEIGNMFADAFNKKYPVKD